MNNNLLAVLAIRPFFFLWLAELFSQIAFNMMNFILIVLAFKLTNSNAAVSGIVLSFTIPAILFGLPAGAYVDRWDKKTVLIATNLIRALFLFSLSFFHTSLLVVYIVAFGVSLATQFFIPAETPMIPVLVKKPLLLSANALFGMGIFASMLLGYAFSGPFLLFFGERYVFVILAAFYMIASFFVTLIRPLKQQEVSNGKAHETLTFEMKNAFSQIIKTRQIYGSLFLLTLSQIVVLILAVVGPGYAKQVVNITVDDFPLFFATPAALGMVLGALVIGNYFKSTLKKKSATIGILISGIAMLILPYGSKVASQPVIQALNSFLPIPIDILHIMILLAVILGFANALVFVPSNTILQEESNQHLRGKIYGSLNALIGTFSLLPIIIVGELADLFGVSAVLSGVGVLLIVIGLVRKFYK